MQPIRGFLIGFALGFTSGVAFRTLAESDFEPVKDVFKTTVGIASKFGDSIAETFGRVAETVDDFRSQFRAETVKTPSARERKMAAPLVERPPKKRPTAKPKTTTASSQRQTSRTSQRKFHA